MIRKYLLYALLACAPAAAKPLTIYWIDVEGGAATLLVTPAGESILLDAGDRNDRDPARIAEVAKQAGVSQIDHVILTHWHPDHFGGVEGLGRRILLRRFYDHGVLPALPENPQQYAPLKEAYLKVTGGHSSKLAAGDKIPLRQADGDPPGARMPGEQQTGDRRAQDESQSALRPHDRRRARSDRQRQ